MSVDLPTTIGGLPFFPLVFDKRQRLQDRGQLVALRAHLDGAAVTDLLVVSHGWNNDLADALRLYERLVGKVAAAAGGRWDDREVAVVGVFWPSKRFADRDLIPGGAAGVEGDVPTAALVAQIEDLRGAFGDEEDAEADAILDELEELALRLSDSAEARRRFVEGVRDLLCREGIDAGADGGVDVPGDLELAEEVPAALFTADGSELLDELGVPRDEELAAVGATRQGGIAAVDDVDVPTDGGIGGIADVSSGGIAGVETGGFVGASTGGIAADPVGGPPAGTATGSGDGAGGAAFLASPFAGMRAGARNALNLATYYTMKRRAGDTGRRGLAPVLRELRGDHPDLRLHLAGHSFGGRLVAAAALGEDEHDPALPVASLTLLQAAFSHHGFAKDHEPGKDGYFRAVLDGARLHGPLLITHTRNDRANTWAYPMASRLARQRAASFGGPDDVYGAIGTNGAQRTPGARTASLLAADGTYDFGAGDVVNLDASAFVADHGEVTGEEVAHLLVSVVAVG
jgi:hypothetical protein